MSSIKKDIVLGVRYFWILLFLVAVLIMGRIFQLQFSDVSELGQKSVRVFVREQNFPAVRGEIYAKNGYLLACSLTYFDVFMDADVPAVTDSVFMADVDSLAFCLSDLFKNKSKNAYLTELKKARRNKKHFIRLGDRKIDYLEAERLKRFPILKRGKYRGGLILQKEILRKRPFGALAERALGKMEEDAKERKVGAFGLEGAYESELKGIEGVKGSRFAPRHRTDFILKEAEEGNDIYTTLDVDIQDVAESSLMEQLQKYKAHHGTAVVMEVKTGEIKAIANLEVAANGHYYERRNHAIADAVEPGSVFKLPSMIALLEEGAVRLTDSVQTGNGVRNYYGANMRDYHACGKITVQEVFEKSSNVGTSFLVHRTYKNKPQEYINRLYDLHLGEPLGLKIKGEGKPYIKEPTSKAWWRTSLPWMSVGYEVQVTPLQMLTLYNAVANNGKMVKPRLVYAIKHNGRLIRDFSEPIVIDNNICSQETLSCLHKMLEGVVERGTATNIKDKRYKIAGKTGTAHIAKPTGGYDLQNYRASFIGYFPADNPKYSCAVIIDKPDRSIGRFGGSVSGPVFKKIADALYAKGMLTEQKPLDSVLNLEGQKLIALARVNENISLKQEFGEGDLNTQPLVESAGLIMPNVVGMSLSDALFLLESKGLKVIVEGKGDIKKQSLKKGTVIHKGMNVTLSLV